ncbi:hypothetical protein Droror1_Dr00026548 [Drosera rotundifolia]
MTKVIWEHVDELPFLSKIPANVIYLKFEFTYNPSIPSDPNFKRIFIYKMKRECVACLPAAMLWDMFVQVTRWHNLMPQSIEAMAKLISKIATLELKKQYRAFEVFMVLLDALNFEEIMVHYVTWSANGTMMRCEEKHVLCTVSRFFEKTGIVQGTEKYRSSICSNDNTNLLRSLPRKHMFHDQCVREWATSSTGCPTCQSPLPVWARRYSEAGINNGSPSNFQKLMFMMYQYMRRIVNSIFR